MDGGGGNPGGFDPCECIRGTQRLINLINQQSDYCTENECITELPGGLSSDVSDASSAMLFMGFWIMMAIVLFFLRPRASTRAEKPSNNQSGPGSEPPAPSPMS